MSEAQPETQSVIVERELPYPQEKIWRALTQPHLIQEWLMKGAFKAEVGHQFTFDFDWGAIQCEVLTVDLHKTLAYTWGDHDLKTVVTWTLSPTPAGTHLRMEQTGFRQSQPRYFQGAQGGWPRFLAALEQLLEKID